MSQRNHADNCNAANPEISEFSHVRHYHILATFKRGYSSSYLHFALLDVKDSILFLITLSSLFRSMFIIICIFWKIEVYPGIIPTFYWGDLEILALILKEDS